MNQIFNRVESVDPNDSDAVKEVLNTFFHGLNNNKDINNIQWLRVLLKVINRFPKYCSSHRSTAEKYLTHLVSSNNYYSVIEAAKCVQSLQQVRPSQDKKATAKSCWRELMEGLCNAAHVLIDNLFTKTPNLNRDTRADKEESSSILHETLRSIDNTTNIQNDNRHNVLCTRLRNIFVFIQAMLVEVYPVPKPIQPQLILEAILRALSSSGNDDSSKVTTVKIEALRTLDAFVACAGSNLIPFSPLIFRFVMHTLRWSFDNPSEESRKVRIQAYSSLSLWLSTLGTYRPMPETKRSWDEELTSMIVNDVTPAKHVIELQANPQSMKNLSKKARKRLANNMLRTSNISIHAPGEKNKANKVNEDQNDDLVIGALECTETFLIVCGLFLKPAIHKQLQELLVRECYSLHKYNDERSVCLLRALEASRKCTSSKVAPPTQYCLQLYSVLRNHSHREISKFCSQALLDIKLHLHCSPPSLNYALEQQSDRQAVDKKKRISERNRAVLESLLGKEKMPTETLSEEVITIPDEPTAKKPRHDDITDQISLSSDSQESVEISDSDSQSGEVEIVIEETDKHYEGDHLNIEPVISEVDSIVADNENEHDDVTDGVIDENPKVKEPEITNNVTETNENNIQENNSSSIYDAVTQHVSNDALDGEKSPVSMEVGYDYTNTEQDRVNVIDKIDDENLPSTNDTDDIQITCGQTVKSSPEESNKNEEEIKENGVETEKVVENGTENELEVTIKTAPNNNLEVTVEDMLADFVDEVNEEVLSEA